MVPCGIWEWCIVGFVQPVYWYIGILGRTWPGAKKTMMAKVVGVLSRHASKIIHTHGNAFRITAHRQQKDSPHKGPVVRSFGVPFTVSLDEQWTNSRKAGE